MVRWADMGAYIELNVSVMKSGSKLGDVDDIVAKKMIDAIGVDRIILDSDMGQKGNGSPVEGMYNYINFLEKEYGITEEQINIMAKKNPAKLLNL
jgi:predicted metal-dependent phosphotriesterase family hydrolase